MNQINDELLAGYLCGECSESEKEQVEAWLYSDTKHRKMFNKMADAWQEASSGEPQWDTKKIWQHVAAKIEMSASKGSAVRRKHLGMKLHPHSVWRHARIWRVAAVIVLAFAGIISYYHDHYSDGMHQIVVEHGKKVLYTLTDGTRIHLDSGSKLRYPRSFRETSRDVWLDGEGYFEVAQNPNKPFRVHAKNAVVQVLGTKFNVRAWEDNPYVQVAVKEGKVSLANNVDLIVGAEIRRDEMSMLDEAGRTTTPKPVDIEEHIGWIKNNIRFREVTFGEVLNQLERWYDLKFVLADGVNISDTLSIHLIDRPIEENLKLLAVLTDLSYDCNDRQITFYPHE